MLQFKLFNATLMLSLFFAVSIQSMTVNTPKALVKQNLWCNLTFNANNGKLDANGTKKLYIPADMWREIIGKLDWSKKAQRHIILYLSSFLGMSQECLSEGVNWLNKTFCIPSLSLTNFPKFTKKDISRIISLEHGRLNIDHTNVNLAIENFPHKYNALQIRDIENDLTPKNIYDLASRNEAQDAYITACKKHKFIEIVKQGTEQFNKTFGFKRKICDLIKATGTRVFTGGSILVAGLLTYKTARLINLYKNLISFEKRLRYYNFLLQDNSQRLSSGERLDIQERCEYLKNKINEIQKELPALYKYAGVFGLGCLGLYLRYEANPIECAMGFYTDCIHAIESFIDIKRDRSYSIITSYYDQKLAINVQYLNYLDYHWGQVLK